MSVTRVTKDPDSLTMTVEATFAAPAEQVWRMWADPRLLERWWGPPSYPATVVDHDLTPGGAVRYFMTAPEGQKYHGWWNVLAVDAPRSLEFEDGFGDAEGRPDPDMPVGRARVTLTEAAAGGTTMTIATTFPSAEAMEQMLKMGMEEGITAAVNQIDGLLAAPPA